jgi:hypothetical protein
MSFMDFGASFAARSCQDGRFSGQFSSNMHRKSAMISARLRRFRANRRSDRRFGAGPSQSPPAGGHPPVSALVAEGEAFDDLDPLIADGPLLDRAAAPQLGASSRAGVD